LLAEPDGVFRVEAVEKGLPESVRIGWFDGGAERPQPERFQVAVAGKPIHCQPDDAALDEGQQALVFGPGSAMGQPRVQPVPCVGLRGSVATDLGDGGGLGLGLGRDLR
jgi:hypothetical protein